MFQSNFPHILLKYLKISLRRELEVPASFFLRSLKEINNYKSTHIKSGFIANLMDLKANLRNWRNSSIRKKEK